MYFINKKKLAEMVSDMVAAEVTKHMDKTITQFEETAYRMTRLIDEHDYKINDESFIDSVIARIKRKQL